MSHRHEWKETYITKRHVDILQFKCECGEQMMTEEIERRLNATECLSAERAERIGQEGPRGETAIAPLLDYARALEDKE